MVPAGFDDDDDDDEEGDRLFFCLATFSSMMSSFVSAVNDDVRYTDFEEDRPALLDGTGVAWRESETVLLLDRSVPDCKADELSFSSA